MVVRHYLSALVTSQIDSADSNYDHVADDDNCTVNDNNHGDDSGIDD